MNRMKSLVHDFMVFLFIKEHEKRCWSVDFNTMDPKLLASGSDDAKGIDVKIPLNSLKL